MGEGGTAAVFLLLGTWPGSGDEILGFFSFVRWWFSFEEEEEEEEGRREFSLEEDRREFSLEEEEEEEEGRRVFSFEEEEVERTVGSAVVFLGAIFFTTIQRFTATPLRGGELSRGERL